MKSFVAIALKLAHCFRRTALGLCVICLLCDYSYPLYNPIKCIKVLSNKLSFFFVNTQEIWKSSVKLFYAVKS